MSGACAAGRDAGRAAGDGEWRRNGIRRSPFGAFETWIGDGCWPLSGFELGDFERASVPGVTLAFACGDGAIPFGAGLSCCAPSPGKRVSALAGFDPYRGRV